ncbi:hypothetical protein LTR37_003725 [Vermiconidia calcicola]|uniref:Uncharacterized protein n=1 Tax=Vermiconidia calcicola TaxID=1690605 RepID=A0ACC3NQE7_9PEZI|nr:hypothetical protein LTR37_003725 [Vermiconidia calcicola]
MPLGYERLNERAQRPNSQINFIKPLTSSSPEDQKIAKDFLERIAAQCYPVMKKDYLSVMALEEYPPNPEFLGRNFNAGEVIQLVLKDKAGRWLSFKFVQMVMMHELAHCKQMNHSSFFWRVRNQYAEQMKELWSKKYTGEGLWGRGLELTSGQYVHDRMPDNADVPEHLCGGTYRSGRGRKRKRGKDGAEKAPKMSYAERQQKRIAKKFGSHGEGYGLGEDELVRGALEQKGKRGVGKPKVAKSKRGRELRANAALARFEAAKSQTLEKTPELQEDDGSETESDGSDGDLADGMNIMDTLERIKDQRGRDLYKVCGDEGGQHDGEEEEGGQNEMDELRMMETNGEVRTDDDKPPMPASAPRKSQVNVPRRHEDSETESDPDDDDELAPAAPDATMSRGDTRRGQKNVQRLHEDLETEGEPDNDEPAAAAMRTTLRRAMNTSGVADEHVTNTQPLHSDGGAQQAPSVAVENAPSTTATLPAAETAGNVLACPICSLENEADSPTCMACSHVLKTTLMPNYWRCKSAQCKSSKYVNPGDAGRCGLCGAQKPLRQTNAIGVIGGDVLRWD